MLAVMPGSGRSAITTSYAAEGARRSQPKASAVFTWTRRVAVHMAVEFRQRRVLTGQP
ncbi:hypothetical protein SALBM311S_04962 [Streptomyces alboniger]